RELPGHEARLRRRGHGRGREHQLLRLPGPRARAPAGRSARADQRAPEMSARDVAGSAATVDAVGAGGAIAAPAPRERWLKARGRGWLIRRALVAADVVGLSLAFVVGELTAANIKGRPGTYDEWFELGLFLLAIPLWIVCAKLAGLYRRDEEFAD